MNSTQSTTLRDALAEAAAKFRYYEVSHRAKNTDDSNAKAEVNAELAGRFESIIAAADATDQGASSEAPTAEDYDDMLRSLCCSWGVGGYNSEGLMLPATARAKIEDGMARFVKVECERALAARPAPIGAVAPDDAQRGKRWLARAMTNAAPAAPIAEVTAPMYTVGPTRCDCHPETCCCWDFTVYSPDGKRHSTYLGETIAKQVADALNATSPATPSPLLDTIERERVAGPNLGCDCGQTREWCKANDCPDLASAIQMAGQQWPSMARAASTRQQSLAVDGAPSTGSAAERDAARWNWLKNNAFTGSMGFGDGWIDSGDRTELDAQIDAAMQQSTTPTEEDV